jgi:hypothetical protein
MAIVLFLLAFVSIGYGIAQRTILAGPASYTAAVTTDSSAPITVIEGPALRVFEGSQSLTVSGSSTVFIADGRADDVRAWVGTTSYNRVTFNTKTQKLTSKLITGKDATAPSPVGSDLWVDEFSGKTQLTRTINVPDTASVIIMSDGKKAAPRHVSVTWPLDNSAPWSGPLIIAGIAALLAGLIVFLWALVHARRRSGPRRKQPRNPKPPQLKRGRIGTQRAIEAPTRRGRRRTFAATGVIVAGTLMLSGCSLIGSPTGSAPSPTPTSTVPGAAGLQQVAVTEPQVKHIVANIIHTVGLADANGDAKLSATRLEGPALQLRTANYAIHAAAPAIPIVPSIPNWDVQVALPQQSDSWPRAVFVVIGKKADKKVAPIAMMLVQQSPRENYKVEYLTTLELDVPNVAPATLGAARLPNDNKLGILAPSDLAAAYGDILIKGDESKKNEFFSATGDKMRLAVGHDYKQKTAAQLPTTAKITFSNGPGKSDPIAFGTNDSGQIVAVDLDDVETVTPVETGAAINPQGGGQVAALLGKAQSTKGVIATYGLQLLFYVPPVTESSKKIQLLGFAQGLISATEVP